MKVFSELGKGYLRWRHSRGYGVHSPFAYDLVKLAVAPGRGYAFYGYHDIDNALLHHGSDEYPRLRRDAMLLLRLLAYLRCRRLLLSRRCQPVFAAAGAAAGAVVARIGNDGFPAPEPADFILLRGECDNLDELDRHLEEGATVMAIEPGSALRERIGRFKSRGLLLIGKRICLAVPNPDMAFVSYLMRF